MKMAKRASCFTPMVEGVLSICWVDDLVPIKPAPVVSALYQSAPPAQNLNTPRL
jgi:hypothetical protein